MVDAALVIAAGTLLAVYALLTVEVLHRTVVAFLGAAFILMVSHVGGHFLPALRILTFDEAVAAVDWNVILLLFGMMVIVAIAGRTGLFQALAVRAMAAARGSPWRLLVLLSATTAVLSAFLDNVTTMLLLTPVLVQVAIALDADPAAYLLPAVFASNVGGAATLIGDPPNILIGSAAGLTFNAFVVNLAPAALLTLPVLFVTVRLTFPGAYAPRRDAGAVVADLRARYRVTDPKLLRQTLAVLAGVILLFVLHGPLEMPPSVAALAGAATLLAVSRVDAAEALEEVEWPTLVFFIMLFILVGAVEATGLLELVAHAISDASGGNLATAALLILWISAIASAMVDNIPFTATMLPVVAAMATELGAGGEVLWWSLALGAAFGGNGTLVGASANVVTAGMAERAGHPLTFRDFLYKGVPVMLATTAVATVYLVARYGLH